MSKQQFLGEDCQKLLALIEMYISCLFPILFVWDSWLTWTFIFVRDNVFLIVFRFGVWMLEWRYWLKIFAGTVWCKVFKRCLPSQFLKRLQNSNMANIIKHIMWIHVAHSLISESQKFLLKPQLRSRKTTSLRSVRNLGALQLGCSGHGKSTKIVGKSRRKWRFLAGKIAAECQPRINKPMGFEMVPNPNSTAVNGVY